MCFDNGHWKELADEHRQWLSSSDPQYLANWEKIANSMFDSPTDTTTDLGQSDSLA